MATLDVFMPDVLVHVPGAPDPYVRQCLIRAAREFCGRTYLWKDWIACTNTPPSRTYTFTLPTDAEMVRFERATIAGVPLEVGSFTQPERDWETYAADDNAQQAITDNLVTFTLTGPLVTGTVQAQAAFMPTLAATTVPDLLASRYMEVIARGAAARLLNTVGASFYKPQEGAMFEARFQEFIGRAGVDVFRGHTRNTPRSRITWC